MGAGEKTKVEKMVFVVGSSRSGTHLMSWIIGLNERAISFNELHFFEQLRTSEDQDKEITQEQASKLAARLMTIKRDSYFDKGENQEYVKESKIFLDKIPQPLTKDKVFEAMLKYEAELAGKSIIVEKTPRNVFYIEEILSAYPDALVVNMVRDPRAVLLSQKNKWRVRYLGKGNKQIQPFHETVRAWLVYHPLVVSNLWKASVAACERFRGNPRVLSLRFEDLLDSPETVVRDQVCKLVGIEYSPEMLQVPRIGSSTKRDNKEEMGIRNQKETWKKGLNSTELYLCQKIAGPLMDKNGYVFADIKPSLPLLLSYRISLPLKMGAALAMSFKRIKNFKETFKKRLAAR